VRLGILTKDEDRLAKGRAALEAFAGLMEKAPRATESLVLAAALYLDYAAAEEKAAAPAGGSSALLRRKPLTLEAHPAKKSAAPGETLSVTLRLTVDEGWHVNSHAPLQADLAPTAVSLKLHPSAALRRMQYPEGKEVKLAFSDAPLSVYQGAVEFTAPVAVAPDAAPGPTELHFELRAQACNDQSCAAPAKLTLTVPVEIIPHHT